ncbi:22158_t:CDS:1, partial [Entrophospora sp. SA101]
GIHMNAGIVRWDMGNGTWMGGLPPPPSIPLMMGPPMSKQIEFERHLENQHEFARYDNQNLRASGGYYDQYYGLPPPMPMTPYD